MMKMEKAQRIIEVVVRGMCRMRRTALNTVNPTVHSAFHIASKRRASCTC